MACVVVFILCVYSNSSSTQWSEIFKLCSIVILRGFYSQTFVNKIIWDNHVCKSEVFQLNKTKNEQKFQTSSCWVKRCFGPIIANKMRKIIIFPWLLLAHFGVYKVPFIHFKTWVFAVRDLQFIMKLQYVIKNTYCKACLSV